MTRVLVLVPVLNRPHRVAPLLCSIRSTAGAHRVDELFLVSPGDPAELAAIEASGARHQVMPWPPGPGDYAKKHNHGFRVGVKQGYEWMFLGADDIEFQPGWLDAALAAHRRTGACVVGTNDLANERVKQGRHSTHTLVHRDYLECGTADSSGMILHEGYGHWFVDDEFIQTAVMRRTFVAARDSRVKHYHPLYGQAPDDDTYRRGQLTVWEDKELFERRQRLWNLAMSRVRRR